MSDRVTVDVYFDFSCPYVDSAAAWLREVNRQLGDSRIEVNWKFFPLEQVNAPADADMPIWDLPPDRRSRGRDSFHAAAAARRQGGEAFERFHAALLALKHEEGQDHGKRSTLNEAASRAQLDLTRFAADLEDRRLLKEIESDYVTGREGLGVFGTPTFVFPNGAIGLSANSAAASTRRGSGVLAGLRAGRSRPAVSTRDQTTPATAVATAMQSPAEMQQARLARIRGGLLGWFKEHARDLPWRRTRDPYAILVSEVMLQQTQVDRVLPYYTRFLERFPTVEDLATAATSDVIRIWSGLGYNRRAVNLQRAARARCRRAGRHVSRRSGGAEEASRHRCLYRRSNRRVCLRARRRVSRYEHAPGDLAGHLWYRVSERIGSARSRQSLGPAWSWLDLESSADRVRSVAVHGSPPSLHRLSAARRVRGLLNDAVCSSG